MKGSGGILALAMLVGGSLLTPAAKAQAAGWGADTPNVAWADLTAVTAPPSAAPGWSGYAPASAWGGYRPPASWAGYAPQGGWTTRSSIAERPRRETPISSSNQEDGAGRHFAVNRP